MENDPKNSPAKALDDRSRAAIQSKAAETMMNHFVEVPILPNRHGSLVTETASRDYEMLNPDGTFDF